MGTDDTEAMAAYSRSIRVVRDVVFFFHQQADYSFVMDDLDYSDFTERYWNALVEDEAMDSELQRGCLALLFAMGMYEAGNIGVALGDALQECLTVLTRFEAPCAETRRIKEAALQALTLAAMPQERRDFHKLESLVIEGEWIHRVAVRPYFRKRVKDFDENAYF